ncbi:MULTISPECIES: type III PLP-dependent enzyme [Pseudomonadaceae]|jgi:ornithine decarboxylase|uniref:ornithine decarboxylase n=1 Tax=Ectopseudomonas alcaliphila TaxID=101564 RepID=A0A1G6XEG1_9GAMM|nr:MULTISPECIES: type III PLP-dependent enzyme [Pseudomonas]PKM27789.1 MAG: type III PLP-dependent enzyme [Gammaproteobacteria bacterium HGW-Gammaproteobacteria-12]MDP9938208.1 ornithine decarboxylase [Pseudomonas sp. 3400]MDR7010431.1 ornithine decarboxylase [Pseudomonas alcaliphila]MDX5992255.1 type III PLP-dependent enzyme [Pseudomonas alcaliphila]SDD75685.1 ornithine decarboxylase [Pseudomonas alcaliphila]
MSIKVEDYYAPATFQRMKAFADQHETPFVVIDRQIISDAYDQLGNCFPFAKIYYAVKANPATEIIELLRDKGSSFDIASIYELDKVMATGVGPERISYGNTIKKSRDIRYFFDKGVRLFATDSEADLRNIAKAAPGSKIYVRILTEGSTSADWPLSRKFGCQPDMALDLLILAKQLGLVPYGISFHVGSQQRDIDVWDAAIAKVKVIFERLKEEDGITLQMINMGGGFPANYIQRTNDLETYAEEITRFLKEDFGDELPEIILEPGRSLIANAGVLVSEVVLVARKSRTAVERWVYADVGKFSGLIETMDESIKFPIWTEKKGEMEEVVIAGPTCDSADIMYEHYKYGLPLNLASGDRLYWLSTGAYTTSYSAVEFNGFPPLKSYYL